MARTVTASSQGRAPVSVVVAARDEAATLPEALGSVLPWAGEVVVVVDPRTTDDTRGVARRLGAVVHEHPFESSSQQLSWGVAQCSWDWVFVLDADERVDGPLARGVAATVASPAHPAYRVRRRNVLLGRRVRFGDWGADRVVRLLHRGQVRLAGGMHWRVEAASVGTLPGSLEHHTCRSLAQYLPKVHAYAAEGAERLAAAGRRGSIGAATLRAAWRFGRAYLLRLGFLDGAAGLLAALLGAHATFLKWALLWEYATRREGGEPSVPLGGDGSAAVGTVVELGP